MNIFSALLLGIVQGLTEFLPVSSSGHLVIVQSFIPGFSQPGVLFDAVLHGGTILAIVIYFRRKIIAMKTKYLYFLLLGSIPAAFFGFLFNDAIESLFDDLIIVGFALLLTGVINLLTDVVKRERKDFGPTNSVVIGLAQAVAIIPGISRSGLTIFAGSWQGIDKNQAAEFSFLLSIPVILGANLLQFVNHGLSVEINYTVFAAGFVSAALAGYLSIGLVLKLLARTKFKIFGIYCLLLGVILIFLG